MTVKFMNLEQVADARLSKAGFGLDIVGMYKYFFMNRRDAGYSGPTSLEDLQYFNYTDKEKNLISQMIQYHENPNQAGAAEFATTIKLLSGVLEKDVASQKVLLQRVNNFQDKKVSYDFLQSLRSALGDDMRKPYMKAIVSNENSIVRDFYDLSRVELSKEEAHALINDAIAKADKFLTDDMQKDVPDVKKIEEVIDLIKGIASDFSRKWPEFDGISAEVNKKYDFDKIVGYEDGQYIQHYKDAKEIEISELKKLIKDTEKNVKSGQIMQSSLDEKAKELSEKDKELINLRQEIEVLKQEKLNMERANKLLNANIKMLIEAGENMKGGIGSKGVNDMKDLLRKIER